MGFSFSSHKHFWLEYSATEWDEYAGIHGGLADLVDFVIVSKWYVPGVNHWIVWQRLDYVETAVCGFEYCWVRHKGR